MQCLYVSSVYNCFLSMHLRMFVAQLRTALEIYYFCALYELQMLFTTVSSSGAKKRPKRIVLHSSCAPRFVTCRAQISNCFVFRLSR